MAENNTIIQIPTFEQSVYENSISPARYLTPIFNSESSFSFRLFINDLEDLDDNDHDKSTPEVEFNDLALDSNDNLYFEGLKIPLNENLKHNGSLYLHCYISESNSKDDNWGYKRLELLT